MCEMRTVVLASVLAGLLLLAALPASASAGLAGWQYQREIAVQENSGETLRDYQVPVALSGSDFPEEAEVDGDDIRFTDADGRELSYWVEEFDAGSKRAAIWVKVPLIPANGEAGITMWYGNPGAKSGSDGEAVFEFFDDFDAGVIDNIKWKPSRGGIGNADESGGTLNLEAPNTLDYSYGVQSISYFTPSNIAVRFRSTIKYAVWTQIGFENNDGDMAGGDDYIIYYFQNTQSKDLIQERINGRLNRDYSVSFMHNVYAVREMQFTNSNTANFVENGNILKSGFPSPSDAMRLHLAASGNIGWQEGVDNANIDWIFVRSYAPSEPTVALAPPTPATHTALTITKSPTPHSIRQFQETTITIAIDNSGTTDATDIEITDAIHPSFDLISGDFPNPKRYDLIRPGETRDLQYTLTAKESGTFTLDPATVTYADEDGNIQEAKSEPASIKVIPSTEGGTSGGTLRSNPSISTASVQLHGEKTSVVLGEDILLKLSAVNLITKPTMHVQVIIIPPSGMSVTSSAFAKSGAGQYTTTYELEPGTGKDIEVAIRSNQVGDFDVNGRIIYYFGGDREDAEDHTLILPITVRAEPEQTVDTSGSEEKGSSTPGFAAVFAAAGVLLVALLIKRRRLR